MEFSIRKDRERFHAFPPVLRSSIPPVSEGRKKTHGFVAWISLSSTIKPFCEEIEMVLGSGSGVVFSEEGEEERKSLFFL